MSKEFKCKGKRLSDFLIGHGSKLIKKEIVNGSTVYVFEYDNTIDKNIEQFESLKQRCLF